MILIYELDLDIPKKYPPTKMNFLAQGFQKLEHYDRQTHILKALARRIREWQNNSR